MKLKKLTQKLNRYFKKYQTGTAIKPKKLKKIQQLLLEKKQRYNENLASNNDPDKRQKLELKLSVVDAQLQKAESIMAETENDKTPTV